MQCTLYIPHLLPPRELGESLWQTVDAPQLKTLLARSAWTTNATNDPAACLCRLFGVARQQDWPLAPLLAHYENVRADSGYWLCATPVHLETRRNALVLTDPASLAVSAAESAAFAAMLADHLRAENVTLHTPRPGHWFLHCDLPPTMTTTSLAAATGRDVRLLLPQGADSARWHRILTEIQMLLHAHPANDARESSGHLPVNSVWLWGGGTLPEPASATVPFAAAWSDNPAVRALAHYRGCRLGTPPERMAPDTVEKLEGNAHLYSLETLEMVLRQKDAQAWNNAVTVLNRDWFIPLMNALKSQSLSTLTVLSVNDTGTQEFALRRGDIMKFWRKNNYLH